MSSLSDLFPPGTDLCTIPSGTSPDGKIDFSVTGLRSLTISLVVILTTLAVIFGLSRLYTNFRKYTWSDCVLSTMTTNMSFDFTNDNTPVLVLITIVVNICQAVLVIVC